MSTATPNPTEDPALVLSSDSKSSKVRVLTLNRPKALNAISSKLADAIFDALVSADADPTIRAIVLTGAGRTFSAGADLKEMQVQNPSIAVKTNFLASWNNTIASIRTPILAAVNGLALGGGFELALMCDIVHCSTNATFSLPEINVGTIPGAGGTQRLAAAVGKSTAMQMILTGTPMTADDALRYGIVTAVHPSEDLVPNVIQVAERIAERSQLVVDMAKQAIDHSQRVITDGMQLERRLYYLTFGTEAFREGVSAFLEKRKPNFDDC